MGEGRTNVAMREDSARLGGLNISSRRDSFTGLLPMTPLPLPLPLRVRTHQADIERIEHSERWGK